MAETTKDTSDIDGNMPWGATDNSEPYLEDTYAAGAAMVLKKGLPLSNVTTAEKHRFKVAFMRAFLVMSPEAFEELCAARTDEIARGSKVASDDATRGPVG